jgi:hypothetical protein
VKVRSTKPKSNSLEYVNPSRVRLTARLRRLALIVLLVLAAGSAVSFRCPKLRRMWRSYKPFQQSNLSEKAQKSRYINRGVRFFDHDDGSHCLSGTSIIRRNISRISSYGGVAANADFVANLAIM